MMEYPETSITAYVIALLSVFITMLSIVLFCVETLPSLSDQECKNGKPNYVEPFFILETICTIWFSWEVILRLISCPNRITYFKDFKNIVDIAAIVPYYVQLGNMLSSIYKQTLPQGTNIDLLYWL
jgi:hypothetical protein